MNTYQDSDDDSEVAAPNLLEWGINIIECADWITPMYFILAGYTVLLFETDNLDEACMYQIAWKMRGVDCVLYGNAVSGYLIMGKRK